MNPFRFNFTFVALLASLALFGMSELLGAQTSRTNSSSGRSSGSSRSSSSGSRSTSSGGSGVRSSSMGGGSYSSGGSRQYRSNTMLGDATIQVDAESRSVVVVTDEETHKEILKVIDELDHPKPQVLIKVVFVEVTLDKALDVGLEGSYAFKVGNGAPLIGGSNTTVITKSINTPNGTATSTSTLTSAAKNESLATVGTLFGLGAATSGVGTVAAVAAENWNATLHALEARGNLHVLSRPSIMARNNQEAVIVVGQEVPFVTNSQTTDNGTVNNTIQYQDVGIILRVTPFITADKTVEMIVNPEISSLSNQTVDVSNGIKAPVINKRAAETVVVTPNATTVVIGGMMQKQEVTTVTKVPLLGDIPYLGIPFRHTVKAEQKTELMIFLTPFIVESANKLKAVTLHEADNAEMTREAFSSDELNKNLEPLLLLPVDDEPGPKVVVKPDARKPAVKK